MREERGRVGGDILVYEEYTLWGAVGGDVRVIEGGRFYLRGAVYGSLTVESGGRAHVFGQLKGDLHVHEGAKVIHSGIIGGDAVNEGGRLYIDKQATILGRTRTRAGETVVGPQPDAG